MVVESWKDGKVTLSEEQYKKLTEKSTECETLKGFLRSSNSIDELMQTFKLFGIKPHNDLLQEIKQANVDVWSGYLKEWEE